MLKVYVRFYEGLSDEMQETIIGWLRATPGVLEATRKYPDAADWGHRRWVDVGFEPTLREPVLSALRCLATVSTFVTEETLDLCC